MRRFFALFALTASLAAGELDLAAPLPVDPANIYGRLDNGMRTTRWGGDSNWMADSSGQRNTRRLRG